MKIAKYLTNIDNRYLLSPFPSNLYKLAVVIPVYGDYQNLKKTLTSLSLNDYNSLGITAVILSVNAPEIAYNENYLKDNLDLIENFCSGSLSKSYALLNLFLVDASSDGKMLKGKGGVGLARKLGMDLSLKLLDWESSPLIASLDADTLVEPDYISSIIDFFEVNLDYTAASIAFLHQKSDNAELETAIRKYEFYLKNYVDNLNSAGSPYAYFTIGSAMAFRSQSYIKAGGMKTQRGGEDFYFMQALRKTGLIGHITQTTVHPDSRISDRVPFGTGPKLFSAVEEDKEISLYNPLLFELIKKTLTSVKNHLLYSENCRSSLFSSIPSETKPFFESYNFSEVWNNIYSNTIKKNSLSLTQSDRQKLLTAFNVWFDAFKTLKLLHFLELSSPDRFPRITFCV